MGNLNNLFANGSILINVTLIVLPILLLIAISVLQCKENLYAILMAIVPIYILFVFLYTFVNFRVEPRNLTDANGQVISTLPGNNFNSTNLAIYGSILFVLLPLDFIVVQNFIKKVFTKEVVNK